MARPPRPARSRFSGPILWVGLCVGAAAIVVQTTRTGIDILGLLVAAFVLLVLERTLGDWVAETVGPAPTALIFAAVAALGVAYMTTEAGRGSTGRLLDAADARGYRPAYFNVRGTGRRAGTASPPGSPSRGAARPVRAPGATAPAGGTPPSPVAPVADSKAGQTMRPGQAAGAKVAISRLQASPDVAVTGEAVELRAHLTSGSESTLAPVEFSVDGRVLGTARTMGGVATVQWKPMVPGRHVVRARLLDSRGDAQITTTINVVPGSARTGR